MSEHLEIEPETKLVPYQPQVALPSASLFGTSDPIEVVARASRVAETLKGVISAKGLISKISGKEYPRCEAWTLLGTMLGVFPVLQWTRPVENGWEARVEARTREGAVVGAAEAQCLKSEKNWSNRDDFALRSMAQTRATAKALRMPLGFVMTLGGIEPTPAEELDFEKPKSVPQQPQRRAAGKSSTAKSAAAPASQQVAKPAGAPAPKPATEKTRAWFLAEMRKVFPENVILQWAVDHTEPAYLMPNEHLEDFPLTMVPTTKGELANKIAECAKFMNVQPTPQISEAPQKPAEPPKTEASETLPLGDDAQDQPWYNAVVPVPHRGERRHAYMKHPDTIGSLYEARHDEEARNRLFGFASQFEPKGWTKQNGEEMPPSAADVKFRADLDAFQDWFEAHHPDEVRD